MPLVTRILSYFQSPFTEFAGLDVNSIEIQSTPETTGEIPSLLADNDRTGQYSELFSFLHDNPITLASLCRLLSFSELDGFLPTVFTLYSDETFHDDGQRKLLKIVESVLTSHFHETTRQESLLRANTSASRLISAFARRGHGQEYLKTVLREPILGIVNQQDRNLEIIPHVIYNEMIKQIEYETGSIPNDMPQVATPSSGVDNAYVKAILVTRVAKLQEISNNVLSRIINSLDHIPHSIRWICKQIRDLTMSKFPNADPDTIRSLIGGFFFLRFINPAITAPHAYSILQGVPLVRPQRILTIVAKILQNLTNKPSYEKETYMSVFSTFVEENQSRMNKFLNDICVVNEAHDLQQLTELSSCNVNNDSPIEGIQLEISLNEIYHVHALVLRHRDSLHANNARLMTIIDQLGPAPNLVKTAAENRIIVLPLNSCCSDAV